MTGQRRDEGVTEVLTRATAFDTGHLHVSGGLGFDDPAAAVLFAQRGGHLPATQLLFPAPIALHRAANVDVVPANPPRRPC